MPKSRKRRRSQKYRQQWQANLESLEPRNLLDASGLLAELPVEHATDVVEVAFLTSSIEVGRSAASDSSSNERIEIVFIDAAVENHGVLTAGVSPSAQIVMLDPERDGMSQIAAAMKGLDGIQAIHIVSHGDPSSLRLGNAELTSDSMDSTHADELDAIRKALTEDADILIYGCNFGSGKAAMKLSNRTGADVAASDDLTGHSTLGGDWDLEVQVGVVETDVIFTATAQSAFAGVLAPTPTATVNVPADTMLGETFDFTVVFDNAGSPGDVGYQPFLDIVFPVQGAEDANEGISLSFDDNGTPTTSDDTPGVTFLGQQDALEYSTLTLNGLGEATHPLTSETITGTPGDVLLVVQPHVGSFAPGQPELTIDLIGLLSNFANLTDPLDIKARAGFDFGAAPTDGGNILSDGTDSAAWTASGTVAPKLVEMKKTYLGTEDETATGPNFPRQYQLDINIADGQTITDLDIRDYLPNNARFLQVVSTSSTDPTTNFTETPPTYSLDPVTNQLTYPDPHELLINASTVTGEAGETPEITIIFEYYIAEFDSQGDRVIPDDNALSGPASGDGEDDIEPASYPDHAVSTLLDLDSTSPNDADALGDWDPLDPDDANSVDNVYTEPVDLLPDHILDDKSIAIQKGVALFSDNNTPGYSPGDVVEYTLNFQISDYYTFGDLAIYDILGDGLLFDQSFDPEFTISDRSGSHSSTFNWSVSSNPGDQVTPGAADTFALPSGNLLVDESRVDRTDDGAENPVTDGTSHIIFDVDQALIDDLRASGILQGGVVLTDAELRPGDGTEDEHDDAPSAPAVGQITYRAIIQQEFADEFPSGDRSVDHGDVLSNTVDIYGTVRDNIVPATVTHREDDDSGASIETSFGQISKSIYAINDDTSLGSGSGINDFGLIVGDTITYSIEYTLPNSNFEDLELHDFLPFPVLEVDDPNADDNSDESTPDDGPAWFFDSSAPSSTIPAIGVISIGENDTFYGVSSTAEANAGQTHYENNVSPSIEFFENRLTMNYGDFDTDQEVASTIHLYFTIRINDAEFSPDLYLTNTTRVTEASTNGPNNVVDDLILIRMETPSMQVRKGVVAASSPNAVYSTAAGPAGVVFAPPGTAGTPFSGTVTSSGLNSAPLDADVSQVSAGDTVRFAFMMRNLDARAPLFDARMNDTLPAGLSYVPNSLQIVDGTGDVFQYTDLDGQTDGSGFFGSGIELVDPGTTESGEPDYRGQRGAIDGYLSGDGRNVAIAFYDVIVEETAGTQGDYVNTGSWLSGARSEGGSSVGSSSDTATISRARVDLELDKQISNLAPNIGDVVTWTVAVTNNAANATTTATGVVIDDTIPSGQQIVVGSATDTTGGSFDYYTGEWTLGAGIAPGATATLTFESIVGTGGEYNAAQVDLELQAEIDKTNPVETDTVTISYLLTNDAEAATTSAAGVTVADLLPAGVTFVSDTASHGSFNSGTGIWDLSAETLAVGQTMTLDLEVTIDGGTAGTSLPIAASVATLNETDIDSVAGNAAASEDDDATLSIDVDNPVAPPPIDTSSRVWIDGNEDGVQDLGEVGIADVTVELYDVSGASAVFITDDVTDVSGVYSFAGLAASTDYEIRIAPAEFTGSGDLESYRITRPEIETINTPATVEAVSGAATLDRTNDGTPETAADQTIDILTPLVLSSSEVQVIITDMTGGVARLNEDQDVEFTFFDYETSGSFEYYIVDDRFDSDAAGYDDDGDGMTDRAVIPFTTDSTGGVSWSSLDVGVIEEQVDLELEKYVDRRLALEGEEVKFRLILSNKAAFLAASGVTVTDAIPAGLTFVAGSTNASQGTFDGTTWTLGGSVISGETATLTYRARVTAAAGAILANGAEVASVDQLDVDSSAGNDDGDHSEDDEDSAVVLVGTRTATTITNVSQVTAQDQEDWDSAPGNDDHDQSEDDEATATLTFNIPGAIGNTVWVDENSDGVVDAGEPGIPNVLVQLKDNAGVVIATTRTDANGNYLFPDLPANNYFVDIDESTLPAGMTQTTVIPNPNGDQTNQAHTSNGYPIALGSGEENMTGDFGYNYNPTGDVNGNTGVATLGDTIWADTDGDGVQDPGEVGVGGVTVELFTDPDGDGIYDTSAGTTITDANGKYIFDDLAAGSYVVQVDPAGSPVDGWTQTGDPEDWGAPATNPNNQSSPVVLNAGDVNLDIDFGYQPPAGATGTIGTTIWFDLDNSGDDESNIGSEPTLEGVTVSLIQDTNGDGTWDPATEPIIATDVTDIDGQYLFTGLPLDDGDGDADYIVWVNDTNNVLDQFQPSYDPDGTGTPSMSATAIAAVTPNDLNQDFSYVQSTSGMVSGGIGDTIFLDRDNDGASSPGEGIEAVEVLIYDYEGRLIATAFTDENGHYFFDNLDPTEEYRIEVNTATLPPGLTNTVDPDGGNDNTSTYDLGPDPDNIDVDQDFGYVPATPGSIGTLFWLDTDRNGTADGSSGPDGIPGNDDDEPGVAGVTVDLYLDSNNDGVLNPGDTIIGSTVSDANGEYLFSNLPVDDGAAGPVNYIVDVTDVDGVLNGYDHSLGTQDQADDNQSKTDVYPVQLSTGTPDVLTADFGYFNEGAALGNFVWIDVNRDGIQDPEDFGANGVPVTLTIDDGVNPPVVATVLTQTGPNGKDGWYSFDHLLEDEDLDGSEATYTLSVGTHFTSPAHYSLIPTLVDEDSGDASPDREDSDDHAGVVALPVVGFTDVNDQTDENTEQDIASYDFGFVPIDHGDLPDSYNTLNNNSGAFHEIDDVTFLGASVDPEVNGQPSVAATGDDAATAPDDEDGVVFDTPLIPNTDAQITVTASTAGFLNAWIDFNSNGQFDAGEEIATDEPLTAGSNVLTVAVPSTATGTMGARFRFTSDDPGGTLDPDGGWGNGEVEDYVLGSLGDLVWLDNGVGGGVARDGIQNGTEPGVPGVVVNLLDGNGAPIEDANGDAITTTTDGNGNYEFPGLPTGNYKVEFEKPAGYVFTDNDQGADDALDSDANQSTGVTDQTYPIGPNSLNPTVDAGLIEADYGDLPNEYGTLESASGPSHGVDGTTFLGAGVDADSDGQPNVGATGDDSLDGNDDEDGVTFLTPLTAGDPATIQVTPSVDGFLNAWIDFDSDDVLDEVTVTHVDGVALPAPVLISDLNLTGGPHTLRFDVPATATGTMAARFRFSTDAMGVDRATTGGWDNGEVEDYVLGAIGDHVWKDDGAGGGTAGDGIQDGSELPVSGVVVNLLNATGAAILDGAGNPVTTTTDGSGLYEFAGLPPGNYRVGFVEPAGSEFTGQDSGADDSVDSDADPTSGLTAATTIDPGELDNTIDAGIIVYDYGDLPDQYGTTDASVLGPARHVVDNVTFLGASVDDEADGQASADATGDGSDEDGIVFLNPLMPGQSADIQVGANAPGFLNAWIDFDSDGVLDEITVTHVDGVALPTPTNIADLALVAGTTTLRIDVPVTATSTMAARFRYTSDAMATSRSPNGDWNNGEVEDYVSGTIGDFVFLDNGAGGGLGDDGIQNGSEAGFPDIVVNLLDDSGAPITDANGIAITTITAADGSYEFPGLPARDYRVEFELPLGFSFTDQDSGTDDALDSDADPSTGISHSVTIGPNSINPTVDAGIVEIDRGDLPAGYNVSRADGGPTHSIDGITFLGSSVDSEADATNSPNADSDDLSGGDDEDGVVFLTPITGDSTAEVQVTAGGDGFLNAWIDFDNDNTLDEIDVVSVNGNPVTPGTTLNDLALSTGVHNIVFQPPASTSAGNAVRFRFTSDNPVGTLGPDGPWDNGEVEDYFVVYDLAMTKAYVSDTFGNTSNAQVGPGEDVTFALDVTNQGNTPMSTFAITDYIPHGFVLNDSNWAFNDDATATSGGTATFTYAGVDLQPGDVAPLTITLTAVNPTLGNLVNRAEISSDDGNDIDSLADTFETNDAQPLNAGDPTDGVVDNTGGDEDDHDIAGIEIFDLALTQTYTSDTTNQTNDGLIGLGSDVTFTIEITNQGSVPSATFEITDYLPAGFSLNDTNWTFNNDATATSGGTATFTYAGPALIPGESTSVTITLTANTPLDGDMVNWAEISNDAGDDFDSLTNAIHTDDNQPAGPGSPTDGVIDGTDGDEDDHDPAGVDFPNISVEKQLVGTPIPATSGTDGNFDVTYEFTITNAGTTALDSLVLEENLGTQFGGAFVQALGPATITASSATEGPGINVAYDGRVNSNLFDGSASLLDVGQSLTLQLSVEIDPDSPTANYDGITGDGNTDLENRATATANDPTGNPIVDTSDDPTDPTNDDGTRADPSDDDGEPDDPTSLVIPDMTVLKTDVGFPVAAASGTQGHLDLTFDFEVTNSGNDRLTNLTLVEDLATQFGGAFVQIVGTPSIVASTATDDPEFNPNFDGGLSDAQLIDNSGLNSNLLAAGESVIARIVVEVNPASPTANYVDGFLVNLAVGGSTGLESGQTLSDTSEDPDEPSGEDPTSSSGSSPTMVALSVNLSGSVYSDADGDGIRGPGELGIFGVELILTGTDIGGNPVSVSVLTDIDGDYTFEDVFPGDYTITEIHPPQFIDGNDTPGTLGGSASNDAISLTIPPGTVDDGFDYDFGEVGLRPEFVSKAALLASTPANYWQNLNVSGGSTLGLWVPFEPTASGAVKALLIDAESIDVDVFDENMNLVNPVQTGEDGGTWLVHEGERYFARLQGSDNDFDFGLTFGDEALPVSLEMNDNVVIAVGTISDDNIELVLGGQTHLLTIADYTFEFDASVIDTFHISGAQGNDLINVVGTDRDDTTSALDDRGHFDSAAYSVDTYQFENMTFYGAGGNDYAEVYGSDARDVLQGLPQDSTLTTPDSTLRMLGFERVDAYGRGGDDYAEVYGTNQADHYYSFDDYQVLQGENFYQRTKGFERVDAYGRGGHDTANMFDTMGNDHFYVFGDYSVMQSNRHFSRVKGFEHTKAQSIYGGDDKVYFREVVSADRIFAAGSYASINGLYRSVSAQNFDELETDVEDGEQLIADVLATSFTIRNRDA